MTPPKMIRLRREIDKVDRALFKILKRRFHLVARIGRLKRKLKIEVIQKARLTEMKKRNSAWARAMGLNEGLVRRLFTEIHAESARHQRQPGKPRRAKKTARRTK